jgi:hypothetical protein
MTLVDEFCWAAGDQPFFTKSRPYFTDEEVAEIKARNAKELREEQEQARLDEKINEKAKEALEKTAKSPGIAGTDEAGKIFSPDSTDTAQTLPRTRAHGKRARSQDPVRAGSGLRSVRDRVCVAHRPRLTPRARPPNARRRLARLPRHPHRVHPSTASRPRERAAAIRHAGEAQ